MIRACNWCLHEFIFVPRGELKELRRRLMIADEGFEPVICDDCLEGIGSSIVSQPRLMA